MLWKWIWFQDFPRTNCFEIQTTFKGSGKHFRMEDISEYSLSVTG